MDERPLSALRPGDRATIGRLDGGGPVRRRLLELGLTPGTVVTLTRFAPLCDPIEVRVRGYQLCVRRSEADAVWVQPAPVAAEVPLPLLAYAGAKGGVATGDNHSARGLFRFLRFR
jgi:ferrous iron transport protein A